MAFLFPVFMYHQVVPSDRLPADTHLYITPETLRVQIQEIRRRGFELVTLSEGWRRFTGVHAGACGRFAALTFDDLYLNFYEYAWPVLLEEKVPVTGFVIGRSLTGTPVQNLDDDLLCSIDAGKLQEIERHGVEIGSHTMTHSELTRQSKEEVRAELAESRGIISDIIGNPVPALCYPRGRFSPRIIELVREVGYDVACTTLRGNVHHEGDRFAVKRIRASAERKGCRLRYALSRTYDWLNRRRYRKDQATIFSEDQFKS